MMLYPSMPELLKNIDNQYLLVNVAAKRAREIAQIAEDMGDPLTEKPVKIAINEIASGKLSGSLKEGMVSSADM
ncbi:DNA-directed RNA polymerase subunit omega [Oscillospiraceae bacterium OttesenSCG-928-G22]|nr:DNA-directed RNA polymerase subunit omega [Oscillospiraceae bacterium OttesenSCG-928-G22]